MVQIDAIELEDLSAAFAIVGQLRGHLDFEEFRRRVTMQHEEHGYRLHGASVDAALVGVIGFRPVRTLARGFHLHIDDLVVDGTQRTAGVGRALMRFAEEVATRSGMDAIFLDSRQDVRHFYRIVGFEPHTSTLMRKRLGG